MRNLNFTLLFSFLFLSVGIHLGANAQTCGPRSKACTPIADTIPFCLVPTDPCRADVGEPYEEHFYLSAQSPFKFTNFENNIYVKKLQIDSVVNLPPGLSVNIFSLNAADGVNGRLAIGDPNRSSLNSNAQGEIGACAVVYGTPTQNTRPGRDSVDIVAKIFISFDPTAAGIDPNSFLPAGSRPVNPFRFSFKVPVGEVGPTNCKASRSAKLPPTYALKAYPNPSPTRFEISAPAFENARLTVLGVDGRVFSEQSVTLIAGRQMVDAPSNLTPGVYLLRLQTDEGQTTLRFIR